jgi:DNA-binding NarL/FixJ family response regulator
MTSFFSNPLHASLPHRASSDEFVSDHVKERSQLTPREQAVVEHLCKGLTKRSQGVFERLGVATVSPFLPCKQALSGFQNFY